MFDFFTTIHCDTACGLYLAFASFTLFAHLVMMLGPMGGWASGSLVLLGSSAFTGLVYANSILLALDIDWYWYHVPVNYRFAAYFLAVIGSSGWLAASLMVSCAMCSLT